MTTVVDASVMVAAIADSGPTGRWAEDVLGREPLAAPTLARIEATNIFRRLEQAKRLTATQAQEAHESLMTLDLVLFPFEPLADRVWALRANMTSYDACYVALAEELDAPLATIDRKLARAPGARCKVLVPEL